MPTINIDPSYCDTNKPKVLPQLNTNFKNNYSYLSTPSPASTRSLAQSSSDDTTNVFINSQITLDSDNRSPIDSPSNFNFNNYSHKKSTIRDKNSSRRWIFDEYTDYHEPRSHRVNGN